MKPKLPKGYRWLRTGWKRPAGYRWFDDLDWNAGFSMLVGEKITKKDMRDNGPYIAPIRKRRKKK